MRCVGLMCVSLGIMLVASGCGDGSDTASDPASNGDAAEGEVDQVTVGVIPITDVAAIYLGDDQGFFEERGIELTLEPAQGGAAIVPAVLSGETQFGFSNNISMIIAASEGVPIQLLAPGVASTGNDGDDFNALAVLGDNPAESAADLQDATIGVNTLNNICGVSISESIRKAGGDPTGVSWVEVPAPDVVAALESGRIEAGCLGEPFLSDFLADGGRAVASIFVDVAEDATIASYFTSRQLAESDPDLVERFTEALVESLAYADENPEEVRRIVTTYTALTDEDVADVVIGRFPTEFNRASIERMAELAEMDGLISEAPDLDALLP